MGLRINTNIDALKSHRFLTNNDTKLSKSLEQLSSGLKINSAADGPASLVISENMRAQISGLDQAISNNESAVSLVQTAEGALTEVSRLLIDVRQRAVHAANEGINDNAMLDADQSEIEQALAAVDRIAQTTQFGQKKLLDGSKSARGNATGTGLEFVSANTATQDSGDDGFEVKVSQLASQATFTSGILNNDLIQSGETLTVREGGKVATYTTSKTDTIQGAIGAFSAAAKRSGLDVKIEANDDGSMNITHLNYGSENNFQVQSSSAGVLSQAANQELNVNNGLDIKGTINGESAEGRGQILMGRRGNSITDGLSVRYVGNPELPIDANEGTVVGKVNVKQNALKFQVGANRGQLVSVNLLDTSSTQMARGVRNESGFNALADIDVRSSQGAQDAILLVDKSIEELASNRGALGAFQRNTLESNLSSLRVASENLAAAESSIRDVDMAEELTAFTKNQILTQSATAQLAQANAIPQNVLRLIERS
ncbi:MAG: flagellin [SAR324 cluster bacterium]|nr:flagellin [SAR324 cluster bacterium]